MLNPAQPFAPAQSVYNQAKQRAVDMINAGQRELAVVLLRDLVKQQPRDVQVLHMLGVALQGHDELAAKSKEPESLRLLRFASQLAPANAEVLTDYALACRSHGQLREAFKQAELAMKADPSNPRAPMARARLLQAANKVDEALELLAGQMARHPDPLLSVGYADLCVHRKRFDEGVAVVKPVFDDVTAPTPRRIEAAFLLGHLHDGLGEYDTAFGYFRIGNTMMGVEPASRFDRHIEKWSRERMDGIPAARADGSRAVMVVGMPRSGTTLTEMIIAAHPKAAGVGESSMLNRLAHRNPPERLGEQEVIDAYAAEYLAMLRAAAPDPKVTRVVDKMPENYIYLGLAARILPGLRVVHCVRDPRDTCLSIYFQQFGSWIKYARSLESIGDQYVGYRRLMQHWRDTLDLAIHESVYEDLTGTPEPSIRALVEHVGLPWDPACLEPHKTRSSVHTASMAQVRRPIYKSSSQRWKNYEKHLGPLLERLEGLGDT
jgi:tetratricopeptide (TPR) repeat protein